MDRATADRKWVLRAQSVKIPGHVTWVLVFLNLTVTSSNLGALPKYCLLIIAVISSYDEVFKDSTSLIDSSHSISIYSIGEGPYIGLNRAPWATPSQQHEYVPSDEEFTTASDE